MSKNPANRCKSIFTVIKFEKKTGHNFIWYYIYYIFDFVFVCFFFAISVVVIIIIILFIFFFVTVCAFYCTSLGWKYSIIIEHFFVYKL